MRIISNEGFLLIGFFLFPRPNGLSVHACEKAVRERFPSCKKIPAATQYNGVRLLMAEGLIEEVPCTEPKQDRGRPPRGYQLTPKGMDQTRSYLALFADILRASVEPSRDPSPPSTL